VDVVRHILCLTTFSLRTVPCLRNVALVNFYYSLKEGELLDKVHEVDDSRLRLTLTQSFKFTIHRLSPSPIQRFINF
jgi:hypothetical protein